MLKKHPVILFALALLTGKSAIAAFNSQDISEYAKEVRVAIMQKFYEADSYSNKKCDLNLEVNSDGQILTLNRTDGQNDVELCKIAEKVISRVTLPKFNSNDKDEIRKITLSFRP